MMDLLANDNHVPDMPGPFLSKSVGKCAKACWTLIHGGVIAMLQVASCYGNQSVVDIL